MKTINPVASATSTNFWFSVISLFTITLSVLGINVDPAELNAIVNAVESKQLTAILVAVVGGAMMLYNVFKSQKITGSIKDVINQRNWWTALILVIAGVFDTLKVGQFPIDQAEALVDAIQTGNISLIIAGGWTLIQTLWFMFRPKPGEEVGESSEKAFRGAWEVDVLYNAPITYPALKVGGTPIDLPSQEGLGPVVVKHYVKTLEYPSLKDVIAPAEDWEKVALVNVRKGNLIFK